MQIVEVRPEDEALLVAWHTARVEAAAERPLDLLWRLPEARVTLANRESHRRVQAWAGLVGGDVVCGALTEMSLLDNTSLCTVRVDTPPRHRRQGYGSAMLHHLQEVAGRAGRTTLLMEVVWPFESGEAGDGSPGAAFAARHGFTRALAEVGRSLALPVDRDRIRHLAKEAAEHHSGYRIETATGPVPEAWIEDWVALESRVLTDAPTGELDLEPEVADPVVRREVEASSRAQGRTHHLAVAIDREDRVVAYTELVTTVHDPDNAFQWGTLVAPSHRGHRLGMAVKAANLLALPEGPAKRVATWNAPSNGPMVAINRALGFEPVEWFAEFQLRR